MIQSIGFKNFRRFENFDDMKLGKINIFVGRNNAGKSTVMKAIELFKGNLKHMSYVPNREDNNNMRPVFAFDTEETAEIHIDNFDRALYRNAKRKEITLTAGYNGFHVEIVLDGVNMRKEDSFISVPYSSIHFWNEDMNVSLDFGNKHLVAKFYGATKGRPSQVRIEKMRLAHYNSIRIRYNNDLCRLNEEIASADKSDIAKIGSLTTNKSQLEVKLKKLEIEISKINKLIDKEYNIDKQDLLIDIENMYDFSEIQSDNIFEQVFDNMIEFSQEDLNVDGRTAEGRKLLQMQELIDEYTDFLEDCSYNVSKRLSQFQTEYVPAHAASQKVIFLKDDKNDFLSSTLSSFCKLHFYKKDAEWKFIKKWMDDEHFGIGYDFEIEEIQGAGYMVKIIDGKADKKGIDLADKGVGTIQLMTLLLRLAVIMRGSTFGTTILIEEPEQNIHPKLQEKLADLLLDFHNECEKKHKNVQLIVETHSECLTRRIQNIVAEANDTGKENPFNVYYFDSESKDEPWYKMEFARTGGFKRPFGDGFYGVAAKLDFEILRREMEEDGEEEEED